MTEVGGGRPWEQLELTWEARGYAPCEMVRGSAVVHDSLAFFSSYDSHAVFAYNLENNDWNELPECPQRDFRLAVVNYLLTAVGGESGRILSGRLRSFRDGKWVPVFPPMPTKRLWHTVVSAQNYLIAAGGVGEGGVALSTVEILDTNTLVWYAAASLPQPGRDMSATVCGGCLYFLGGRDINYSPTNTVFTCTLDSLIRSCHVPSQTPPHTASVWQRVADIDVVYSTCTTLNGRVLAIGGAANYTGIMIRTVSTIGSEYSRHRPIATVRTYNSASDSWQFFGHMPTARWKCLVVGLRDCIIAVGGSLNGRLNSASVEVGYLQLSGGCCMLSV